jgi:hypothetical protein
MMTEEMKAVLKAAGLVVTPAMEDNLAQGTWTNEPIEITYAQEATKRSAFVRAALMTLNDEMEA